MGNSFRNGYTCKKCAEDHPSRMRRTRTNLTPLYFRKDGKFIFADLVKCPTHGITEAIALRDL